MGQDWDDAAGVGQDLTLCALPGAGFFGAGRSCRMLLERVIGNSVKATGALAENPATGDFAYPAGCVVVFYSARRNRQLQFLSCENNRPLTCVAFSKDGKHVCAAECGRQPAVLVWDVSNGKLLAELKGHAFSVKCVVFSPDGKMIASAGSQSDGRLHVWNWRTGMLVASARVKSEIRRLCFSGDSHMLVSAGSQGHLKYWELQAPSASGKCRVLRGAKACMDGGPDTAGVCTDGVEIAAALCFLPFGDISARVDSELTSTACDYCRRLCGRGHELMQHSRSRMLCRDIGRLLAELRR